MKLWVLEGVTDEPNVFMYGVFSTEGQAKVWKGMLEKKGKQNETYFITQVEMDQPTLSLCWNLEDAGLAR